MLSVDIMGTSRQNETASRLLARGGQIFGLALMSHLDDAPNRAQLWNSLTPDTLAAVVEIRRALASSTDPQTVEAVICASMSPGPVVSPPGWCRALWEVPGLLRRIGAAFSTQELASALGPFARDPDERAKGIAALGLALCRSLDGLHAVAVHFERDEGCELLRRGHLAHNLAEAGRPSKARNKLRKIIAEVLADG